MNSFISKNILSFMSSSVALGQIFVVVLFFECYSIRFEKQSLLNLKIGFDSIHIKPFFSLLFFIAVARMVWLVLNITKTLLYSFYQNFDTELSSKVSFTAFLLLLVCLYYISLLNENISLSPFYKEGSTYLNRLYLSPFFVTSIITFGMTFFTTTNFSNSNEKS